MESTSVVVSDDPSLSGNCDSRVPYEARICIHSDIKVLKILVSNGKRS